MARKGPARVGRMHASCNLSPFRAAKFAAVWHLTAALQQSRAAYLGDEGEVPPPRCYRGYFSSFCTWSKPNSIGVSRSKMVTRTFSFWVSGMISEMVAFMDSNGPSVTVTISSTS